MSAPSAPRPEISFILTVYNKAEVLPRVLAALRGQALPAVAEYIFVDDASTDASVAVLEAAAATLPGCVIVRNNRNAGPSVRVNQGAEHARGQWLCLLDADECIASNGAATMLRLARDHAADLVHGKIDRDTTADPAAPPDLSAMPPVAVTDTPLDMVLGGDGFVRMAWLVETALFRQTGGCDTRLFVQDEALALRLAAGSRRMIDLRAAVCRATAAGSHLSADKRQQHHDRFFAYYNLLQDRPALAPQQRRLIATACLSTAWKAVRRSRLPLPLARTAIAYFGSKLGLGTSPAFLHQAARAFQQLDGIRRPPPDTTTLAGAQA